MIIFVENKKRQVERESLAGRSDNFKMSEDTLLHKKLSKYLLLITFHHNL